MSNSIVKVKKNSNGEITDYVLSSGKTVSKADSKAEGVKLAEEGMIDGVIISHSKKGEAYLRSIPDGKESNNLDELS
ncbi:TPA: DUF3892 domain-containing protein [Clostridium perfringens]